MPIYEYRCRTCDERFDLRRSAAEADAPTRCSSGHDDTKRLLAAFASTGRAGAGPMPSGSAPSGGGGCGGHCACAH